MVRAERESVYTLHEQVVSPRIIPLLIVMPVQIEPKPPARRTPEEEANAGHDCEIAVLRPCPGQEP
jgi:hypothetical protein